MKRRLARGPGTLHLHSVRVLQYEPSGRGDWQAEARTMDDLGVNIVNYNPDSPEDDVRWLKEGIAGMGILVGSYTVHVNDPEEEAAAHVEGYRDPEGERHLLCGPCAEGCETTLQWERGNPDGPCEACGVKTGGRTPGPHDEEEA